MSSAPTAVEADPEIILFRFCVHTCVRFFGGWELTKYLNANLKYSHSLTAGLNTEQKLN